jgi:hypothetical protein
MGLRCLSNYDNRLTLWRNTIQLFHKQVQVNFTGPFFTAGYKNYHVECPLSEQGTGKQRSPDIFVCGQSGWLVVELTFNDESKKGQLDDDKNLDPRSLSQYGCSIYPTAPDTMSSRLKFNNDAGHCQIVVRDVFDVKEEQFILDRQLRDSLVGMRGQNISRLPEIPFSLVPEMQHYEIRRGLVDIVLQLFNPNSQGKNPMQVCEDGLERLFDRTTSTTKQSLIDRIKREMESLMNGELAGYLEFKDGKYQTTKKFKDYPKTRQAIAVKLRNWAQPTTQMSLSDSF